jgi:hypothetical protein
MRRASILSAILLAGIIGLIVTACNQKPPRPRATPTPIRPAPSGPLTVGLDIGQLAPEIEGVDLHGNRFKLSDYRGKVVMLDFWGNW